jgi:hypothetical protein
MSSSKRGGRAEPTLSHFPTAAFFSRSSGGGGRRKRRPEPPLPSSPPRRGRAQRGPLHLFSGEPPFQGGGRADGACLRITTRFVRARGPEAGALRRKYSPSRRQKHSPAQVDRTKFCQGRGAAEPQGGGRPGTGRITALLSDRACMRRDRPFTALCSAAAQRGPGAALARPAGPVPQRSGGRPDPSAAWAGRRSGLDARVTSSPTPGRAPHSNPSRSQGAGRAGGGSGRGRDGADPESIEAHSTSRLHALLALAVPIHCTLRALSRDAIVGAFDPASTILGAPRRAALVGVRVPHATRIGARIPACAVPNPRPREKKHASHDNQEAEPSSRHIAPRRQWPEFE